MSEGSSGEFFAENRTTDELQDCYHGFFVQIHAVDVTWWCSESGQLMHLDYQYYAGDSDQFLVGVAHGLTLLASSLGLAFFVQIHAVDVTWWCSESGQSVAFGSSSGSSLNRLA